MANGHDEPIQFTRGDAERLTTIETTVGTMKKLIWVVLSATLIGTVSLVFQLISNSKGI